MQESYLLYDVYIYIKNAYQIPQDIISKNISNTIYLKIL